MQGGELFIPKIPSMSIMDLKEAIAPECDHEVVGIRPGEKLHEILLPNDEVRYSWELDGMYIVDPEFTWKTRKTWAHAKRLPPDFKYTSDANTEWLSVEDLRKLIERYDSVQSGV